mgnify:CR=1 FL=1|tara:strand:- start:209 stop:643 length:435 start_codon:yes stop_codon:yes gene_type:complete
MEVTKENTYRILIAQNDQILVNMVYAEINEEVCGAFSGDGGGGLFYFNEDHEVTVSDDYGEFETSLLGDYENVGNIYLKLEKLRSGFEEYDDDGDIIGFSEEGKNFLMSSQSDGNGYIECYSDGASEDFIYDIQYEWNLNFIME